MLALAVTVLACWAGYLWWTRYYRYWESRGVPCVKASFPLGSSAGLSLMNQFQGEALSEAYSRLAPHPLGGVVVLRRPYLLLRDPDLIKTVLIKEFDSFTDRSTKDTIKEPQSHHLFNLPGRHWRVKRVNLGQLFTTSKMKSMFPTSGRVGKDLYAVLDQGTSFDVKPLFSRYTIDFIGSWLFGGEVRSLLDQDSPFFTLGRKLFTPIDFSQWYKLTAFNVVPGLEHYPNLVRFGFQPPDLAQFLHSLTEQVLEARQRTGVKSNMDVLDALVKLKQKGTITSDRTSHQKGIKLDLDMAEISSEELNFYSAGWETTSGTIAHCLWELSRQPDIQERLYNEVEEVVARHGGISYEALAEMTYLGQVIDETLRLYPVVPVVSRVCTKECQLPGGVTVEPDTRVVVSLWSLHRDPDLYPQPDTFDPERFAPGVTRHPFSYLPFGEGPRFCMGKRLGLLTSKVGVAQTIHRYKVTPREDTPKKLKFAASLITLSLSEPVLLDFTRRV